MDYKTGIDRNQLGLFPDSLEYYVVRGSLVSVIDEFVKGLDFEKLPFKHSQIRETGRPPYRPADMLKLYIYGYFNHIRSSRKLEKETRRNVEVMWLLRKLSPDHKTIANFRRDNKTVLKQVMQDFLLICHDLELIGSEVVSIDGSKFRAVNSKKRNFTRKKVKKMLEYFQKKIDEYMTLLNENDNNERDEKPLNPVVVAKKLKKLQKRLDEYEGYRERIEKGGETQVSLTDPDSRCMKDKDSKNVCYNVQTVVDDKHGLIVDYKVTNEVNDKQLLSEMAIGAKESLGVETLTVVADKGYHSCQEIKKCVDAGIVPYVPGETWKVNQKKGVPHEDFFNDKFRYDSDRDAYVCPMGKDLNLWHKRKDKGKNFRVYRCRDCGSCPKKPRCTSAKGDRTIYRWEHQEVIEKMAVRLKANPGMMQKRKELSEHPFGVMKHSFGFGYMLTKGIEKTDGEMALTVLAFNMKRVVNIVGLGRLLEVVKRRALLRRKC